MKQSDCVPTEGSVRSSHTTNPADASSADQSHKHQHSKRDRSSSLSLFVSKGRILRSWPERRLEEEQQQSRKEEEERLQEKRAKQLPTLQQLKEESQVDDPILMEAILEPSDDQTNVGEATHLPIHEILFGEAESAEEEEGLEGEEEGLEGEEAEEEEERQQLL